MARDSVRSDASARFLQRRAAAAENGAVFIAAALAERTVSPNNTTESETGELP